MNAIKNAVNVCLFKFRAVLPMVAVVLTLVLGGAAFADEPVPFTVTEVMTAADFTGVISSLGTSVGTVVKAAIGLSIGIFLVGVLYRLVKRYAKG